MNTYKECIDAINSYKALRQKETGIKVWINRDTGGQMNSGLASCYYTFGVPQNWEIVKYWREELNGEKTLCWVRNFSTEPWSMMPYTITNYKPESKFPFKIVNHSEWRYAKRLTIAEIQKYLDNAPENEDK